MAKDPAFLFYSSDFITGTLSMSFEDRGKYITILALMHQQGRLDEKTICFLVGSISDNLKLKFKVDENNLWYNERLEIETEKRNRFTESRRINGLNGGRPKDKKPNAKPSGKPTDNHIEDVNENVIKDKRKGAKRIFKEPTLQEFKDYCKQNGFENIAQQAYDGYKVADWHKANGDKIINWKQTLHNGWFNEKNRIKTIGGIFVP